MFPKAKIMKQWSICFILIVFFVIGYSVNIPAVILDDTIIRSDEFFTDEWTSIQASILVIDICF